MNKGKLLIIDDEELIVKNLKYLLSASADEIFTALNGEEGLKLFEQHSIQCVICDIAMPKMNGVEVLRRIREQGSKVPFIFFTAYRQEDLMLQAAKLGAFDFIIKPGFEGLTTIVTKGLAQGFDHQRLSGDAELMSEFQTIVQSLKN